MHGARRLRSAVAGVVLILAMTGCQVKAVVDTDVRDDGSGTVAVGIGLDDKALERIGDLDKVVRVDDMRAVGWEVRPAAREADGLTWLRASKTFADTGELSAIMASLVQPPGGFTGFGVTTDESFGRTSWTLTGVVDLTKGFATFADPEVAEALGTDSFGGWIPEIEKAEGKKAADMVDLSVGVQLPHAQAQRFAARVGDPVPVQISATSSHRTGLPLPLGGDASGSLGWLALAAIGGGVVVSLWVLRQRFRTVER